MNKLVLSGLRAYLHETNSVTVEIGACVHIVTPENAYALYRDLGASLQSLNHIAQPDGRETDYDS